MVIVVIDDNLFVIASIAEEAILGIVQCRDEAGKLFYWIGSSSVVLGQAYRVELGLEIDTILALIRAWLEYLPNTVLAFQALQKQNSNNFAEKA